MLDGKLMLGSSGASLVDFERGENEGRGSGQSIYTTKHGITGHSIVLPFGGGYASRRSHSSTQPNHAR